MEQFRQWFCGAAQDVAPIAGSLDLKRLRVVSVLVYGRRSATIHAYEFGDVRYQPATHGLTGNSSSGELRSTPYLPARLAIDGIVGDWHFAVHAMEFPFGGEFCLIGGGNAVNTCMSAKSDQLLLGADSTVTDARSHMGMIPIELIVIGAVSHAGPTSERQRKSIPAIWHRPKVVYAFCIDGPIVEDGVQERQREDGNHWLFQPGIAAPQVLPPCRTTRKQRGPGRQAPSQSRVSRAKW